MGLSNLFGGSSEPEANASPDTTQAFQNMLALRGAAGDNPTVQELAGAAMGQVVAMMGEDARTYMQGMEQIYLAASGKALALIANPPTKQQGIDLLTNVGVSQTQTLTFMTGAATVAAAFSKI
ncbi:hypothetical protein [Azorhizobium caulinodans]|uniref:hypothetical protein n=1 Tax=Azorhizobium caulinodans TaxID=7 RepID=UPI002FBF1817